MENTACVCAGVTVASDGFSHSCGDWSNCPYLASLSVTLTNTIIIRVCVCVCVIKNYYVDGLIVPEVVLFFPVFALHLGVLPCAQSSSLVRLCAGLGSEVLRDQAQQVLSRSPGSSVFCRARVQASLLR